MFEKKFVSMEFGGQNIKLVSGWFKNDSFYVDDALTIPVPEDQYSDGKMLDSLNISESIRQAIKGHQIKPQDAIVTINSTAVITREIVLPGAKAEEMANMVQYEIQQFLPIELSQYVVEYKVLENFTEDGITKNRVAVAAMPKTMAESYFNLIKPLKLNPVAMDTGANALAKLFEGNTRINQTQNIDDKTIALIDLGHKSTNVNIISNGVLKFNRLIGSGGHNINTSIAQTGNFSLIEAEKRKIQISLLSGADAPEGQNVITETVKEAIDEWVQQIQRIFQFYQSRGSGNKVDEIYLYGGGANFKGLPEYMHGALNLPVYEIREMSNIVLSGRASQIDVKLYLNAIGALARNRQVKK